MAMRNTDLMTEHELHACNVEQLETMLEICINANEPLMIVGSPGWGKTEITKTKVKSMGIDCLVLHPAMSDPTEVKGIGAVSTGTDGELKAQWVQIGKMEILFTTENPLVVVWDDMGQAVPGMQAAVMQVIQERAINGRPISEHVSFVLITNYKSDKSGVTGILAALQNRCAIVYTAKSVDDFVSYGHKVGIQKELLHYLQFRPAVMLESKPKSDMENFVTPRTLEKMNSVILKNSILSRDMLRIGIQAYLGKGIATEFVGFLDLYASLPLPVEVLKNPHGFDMPVEPAAQFALCGAVSDIVEPETMPQFVEMVERFNAPEFGVLAIKMATNRDDSLSETEAFNTWYLKNEHFIQY